MINTATVLPPLRTPESPLQDAADKLHVVMRTTVKCRYNAAVRLQHERRISLLVAVLSALGLVFIPTTQNSGIPLVFKASIINVMEAFFGLMTLLSLTLISAARYGTREDQLTACADQLEMLIRELNHGRGNPVGAYLQYKLNDFQSRYMGILAGDENHTLNDFRFAFLDMRDDYVIRGLFRFKMYVQAQIVRAGMFALPGCFLFAESIFLMDMVGVTDVLPTYLSRVAPLMLLHILT